MHDISDYQLASSIESSDFCVKIFVRRPQKVIDRIANLNDVSEHGELTQKELASCMFGKECRDIYNMLHVQAVKLDPETPKKKQKIKDSFQKAFNDAGFDIIFVEEIPNEYHGEDTEQGQWDPWLLVTTRIGPIKVGWRRSVIHLEWERTSVHTTADELFPEEDATKFGAGMHVYGYENLTKRLTRLREKQDEAPE